MKIKFPRRYVYAVLFFIFMLILSIWFSLSFLIPMGKDYRKNRIILKKERLDLKRYEDFYNETSKIYDNLKAKNRNIIQAFKMDFDEQAFLKENKKYFISLNISKDDNLTQHKWYKVHKVNATSKIKSPTNFYKFLDAVNKSSWIIEVTFPIDFKREGELIHSSFKMKVYKKDDNITTVAKEKLPN